MIDVSNAAPNYGLGSSFSISSPSEDDCPSDDHGVVTPDA
jgi:hypothetical protein